MTTTTDPKAHDHETIEAYRTLASARQALRYAADHLLRSVPGTRSHYDRAHGGAYWAIDGQPVTVTDVYDLATDETRAEYDKADDAVDAAAANVARLNRIYAEQPWPRFYLVPQGHLHSSTACQTCNRQGYATAFSLIPELSGDTEAEAVAEMGAVLCTVCYPSAPVEHTDGSTVGRRTQAERDAKAADKAAKLDAKRAKAIHDDLSPLVCSNGDRPATIIAVQRLLSARLQDLGGYGAEHPSAAKWAADARLCAEALAARLDGAADEILATAAGKAAKRVRSEWGRDASAEEILAATDDLRGLVGPLS